MAAATIAGVMNAMAGGGSFIGFPAMMGVGIPPIQANATNTVALWPGQAVSAAALWKDVRRDLLPIVAAVSLIGGVTGAEVLLHTRQRTFLHQIPWLILAGTLTFALSGPVSKWIRRRAAHPHREHVISRPLLALALLPVSFYVGYFGAGSGFMIMSVLALLGIESMHQLNALKVVAAGMGNLVAIVTFIVMGAVVWHDCVLAMAFAAVGGWVGAKFSRRMNGELLRWMVVATGCTIAAYFFWKQAQG